MTTYNRDGATVTITPVTSWTGEEVQLSNIQVSNDFDNRSDKLSFSGSARLGMPIKIATVLVVADTDKHFSTPPYLQSKSRNLKLQFVDKVVYRGTTSRLKTGHGKYYTSYTFDLVFTASKKTFSTKKQDIRLRYLTKAIPTISTEITDITIPISRQRVLSSNGETIRICVYGTKDAEFGLTINERLPEEITEADGTTSTLYQKFNETSILKQGDIIPTDYGTSTRILRGKIPASGKYEFMQEFPSIVSNKTFITTAASSTNRLILKNIKNVRVGDRVFYGQASTSVVEVTHIDPDGDNEKLNRYEIQIDATISLDKGKAVIFKRNKSYQVAFVEKFTSKLNSRLMHSNANREAGTDSDGNLIFRPRVYNYYQFQLPKLTLRHFISGTDITITHQQTTPGESWAETGLGRGNELDIVKYSHGHGKSGVRGNSDGKIQVRMRLDIYDAAHRFLSVITPIFNASSNRGIPVKDADGSVNRNPVTSNWTNSIAKLNGGTVLDITNIHWSATGANTIDLGYDVYVSRWGYKDVTMVLDLDSITSIGTP